MTMNGQAKPIEAELGGALFADGAGTHSVIATLPLAEGYQTTFRNFNVQAQKVALKQLKVVGVEDVTVPAGTFKAWKVEVTSAEGEPGTTTLWIAAEARKAVKISATLPQMGGAVTGLPNSSDDDERRRTNDERTASEQRGTNDNERDDERRTTNDERTNDERRTTNDERRTTNDERRTTNDE